MADPYGGADSVNFTNICQSASCLCSAEACLPNADLEDVSLSSAKWETALCAFQIQELIEEKEEA